MSKEIKNLSERKVFHFEDVPFDALTESYVGRKGLSLFKLHHFDSPVPDFFVISPTVFFQFITRVFKEKQKDVESLKENIEHRDIAGMFSRFDFDNEVMEDIIKQYTRLSGFTDAWVSVRSSVSFPKRPEVSFSGTFETQLNIRGVDNLVRAIKQVYASVFTDSVVKYCVNENIDLNEVGLAIVVQKMVQPEVSGIAFTVDPITQDNTRMSVEAVYGLGDVIANGDITPDSYSLLKKDLAIVEKHIAPQEWMKVRTLKSGGSNSSEKIQISPAWSHRQKVEDKYIIEVSKIALRLEDQLGEALDIEWVLSGGRVWVLQTKSTFAQQSIVSNIQIGYNSFVSDTLYKVVKDFISGFVDAQMLEDKALAEANRFVEKEMPKENITLEPTPTPVPAPAVTVKSFDAKVSKGGEVFMMSGIGASLGVVEGRVKIVKDSTVAVDKSEIVVIRQYGIEMYEQVVNAAGVLTDLGGLTSDVSILCREKNIPAIVGTSIGTSKLRNGDYIRIDGNTGSVYLIDAAKGEQQAVAQEIAKKLNEVAVNEVPEPIKEDVVVNKNLVKEVTYSRDSNLPHTATKVFVASNDMSEVVNSDGVVYISLDMLMVDDGRHPLAYLAEKKYKAYADSIAQKLDAIASAASPNEVVVSIGGLSISKFKKLVKGKEFEESALSERTMGVTRLLDNTKLLDLMLRIVKRTRNVLHNRNVSLAVHSPMTGSAMKEIKKSISASGLRRTSTFNIYAVIENPSEVIVIDDILSADIDGVILNTSAVAKQMQGLSYDNSDTKYDLGIGSVYKVIDNIVDSAKKAQLKMVLETENNSDLLKYGISKGVYGVVVDEKVVDAKKAVSEQEMKILLGKM
ncbi:MAG TPA: PEP/pyruvate-binding domain-containing protein [Candidatus Dojkabacteria bacterium]|nr:PEP/pyruvate-binding domain-containing protein [Candidatus Dojkabacteria bacterium]